MVERRISAGFQKQASAADAGDQPRNVAKSQTDASRTEARFGVVVDVFEVAATPCLQTTRNDGHIDIIVDTNGNWTVCTRMQHG